MKTRKTGVDFCTPENWLRSGKVLIANAEGALVRLLPDISLMNAPLYLVSRPLRPLPPRVAALRSFLLEALLMTVVGGILGTALSLGLIALIAALPLEGEAFEFLGRPTFSPAIAAATAMVLGAVGSLAGFFPARHASSVNPAVSLRYE